MKEVLTDIQNGNFAKGFIDDNKAGFPEFKQMRKENAGHQIEQVGNELRKMMPFVTKKISFGGEHLGFDDGCTNQKGIQSIKRGS